MLTEASVDQFGYYRNILGATDHTYKHTQAQV